MGFLGSVETILLVFVSFIGLTSCSLDRSPFIFTFSGASRDKYPLMQTDASARIELNFHHFKLSKKLIRRSSITIPEGLDVFR